MGKRAGEGDKEHRVLPVMTPVGRVTVCMAYCLRCDPELNDLEMCPI